MAMPVGWIVLTTGDGIERLELFFGGFGWYYSTVVLSPFPPL